MEPALRRSLIALGGLKLQDASAGSKSRAAAGPKADRGAEPQKNKGSAAEALQVLAGLLENNYAILLRGLLSAPSSAMSGALPSIPASAPPVAPVGARSAEAFPLSASPQTRERARKVFASLESDTDAKFGEFHEKWTRRLTFPLLGPFLRRNQWIEQDAEGFFLRGKGTRKESKMLYLQTLHDMASDCERTISALSGLLFRLQNDIAAAWVEESVGSEASKALPALEMGIRLREFEIFKRIRLSLGDLAQEKFMDEVKNWSRLRQPTEEELFRRIAAPWYRPPQAPNGFIGFMKIFADFSSAFSREMQGHYRRKWDLLLAGTAP